MYIILLNSVHHYNRSIFLPNPFTICYKSTVEPWGELLCISDVDFRDKYYIQHTCTYNIPEEKDSL